MVRRGDVVLAPVGKRWYPAVVQTSVDPVLLLFFGDNKHARSMASRLRPFTDLPKMPKMALGHGTCFKAAVQDAQAWLARAAETQPDADWQIHGTAVPKAAYERAAALKLPTHGNVPNITTPAPTFRILKSDDDGCEGDEGDCVLLISNAQADEDEDGSDETYARRHEDFAELEKRGFAAHPEIAAHFLLRSQQGADSTTVGSTGSARVSGAPVASELTGRWVRVPAHIFEPGSLLSLDARIIGTVHRNRRSMLELYFPHDQTMCLLARDQVELWLELEHSAGQEEPSSKEVQREHEDAPRPYPHRATRWHRKRKRHGQAKKAETTRPESMPRQPRVSLGALVCITAGPHAGSRATVTGYHANGWVHFKTTASGTQACVRHTDIRTSQGDDPTDGQAMNANARAASGGQRAGPSAMTHIAHTAVDLAPSLDTRASDCDSETQDMEAEQTCSNGVEMAGQLSRRCGRFVAKLPRSESPSPPKPRRRARRGNSGDMDAASLCFCGTDRHLDGGAMSFDGNWVQCDGCDLWCHAQCTELQAAELSDVSYFCPACK